MPSDPSADVFLEDHSSGAETEKSLSPEVSAVVLLDSDGAGLDFFIVFSVRRRVTTLVSEPLRLFRDITVIMSILRQLLNIINNSVVNTSVTRLKTISLTNMKWGH